MHSPTASALTLLLSLLVSACSSTTDPAIPTAGSPAVTAPTGLAPVPGAAPNGLAVSDPNPEHGQPGHRCEIPVGASLSTAPSPGTINTDATTSPMINSTNIAPVATDGTARLNPAHGEPGHDCNIAVGAPLP